MFDILPWEQESPKDNDAKKRVAVAQFEAQKCKQTVVFPGFCSSDYEVLRKFGTQQVRRVQRASTPASTYASRDCHIKKSATFLCWD